MKNITMMFICGVVLLLTGCQEVKREYSTILHEDAFIENVVYTPSTHESRVEPSFGGSGAIGLGPSGAGIRIGKSFQITNVTVPEEFAVVFKCQHGQFIISRKEVYEKLKNYKGKTVDVAYREIYRVTYDTRENKKQIVERVLVDYDFLDTTFK